jgi:aminoglycoside phosphotransferase (APT) family kinase protein
MNVDLEPALIRWLADRLDEQVTHLSAFRRHTEGFSWQTYTFEVHWVDSDGAEQSRGVAVRREPEDGLLAPYDIVGQYRLHEALVDSDIPVPGLIGLETDAEPIGMPFYAMDRVEGVVPVQWQGKDPTIFPDEETRHRIGVDFIDTLARIHAIDHTAARLGDLLPGPADKDPGTAELDRWERFLDDATLIEVPMLRAAISWCRRNIATSGRLSLCHGDYRIGNFMLRDHQIVAVFDWELAHIGDPVEDLAWAGLRLFRGRSPLVSQLIPLDATLAQYRDRTGLDVEPDVLRFWTVVCMIRAAAPHLRAASAFETGRSSDLRLAAMGHQTLHVLRHLADELGWSDDVAEVA